jgi:hypothetical protein
VRLMAESAVNTTASLFGAVIMVFSTTKLGHIMVLVLEPVPISSLQTNFESTAIFSTIALVAVTVEPCLRMIFKKDLRESSNLQIVPKNALEFAIRTPIVIVVQNYVNAKLDILDPIAKLIYVAVLCAVTTDSVPRDISGAHSRLQRRRVYAKTPGWGNTVTAAPVWKWILIAEMEYASP